MKHFRFIHDSRSFNKKDRSMPLYYQAIWDIVDAIKARRSVNGPADCTCSRLLHLLNQGLEDPQVKLIVINEAYNAVAISLTQIRRYEISVGKYSSEIELSRYVSSMFHEYGLRTPKHPVNAEYTRLLVGAKSYDEMGQVRWAQSFWRGGICVITEDGRYRYFY